MPELVSRLQSALEGRYHLDREVGAGGMATVYLAQDLRHDRRVALKVLRPELAAVIGAERFLAEIKLTANLQHPHILPLFDSGAVDSQLFYVMPFVEGETLRDRITREKQPRPWTTPTGTAWSTGTSSRRTSCCTTARPWWPTSGSRWPRARRAAPG
jgi:serine/threonine protein kinase